MPRTTLPQMLRFGGVGFSVGSFLGADDLAAGEQAGLFDPFSVGHLWGDLAARMSAAAAPWDDACQKLPEPKSASSTAEKPGKQVLRELQDTRKCFVPPCPECAPGVTALSPRSLQMVPRPNAPWHSRVALKLGAYVGSPLAVGLRLTYKGGRVNEGVCVGVELVGARGFMSYSFAPVSGRCFMELGMGMRTLCADALPPLVSPSGSCEVELERVVDVWVKVTSEGGIVFKRQVLGRAVEATKQLPPQVIPEFVEEYHSSVHFYSAQLEVPVLASVLYSGQELPPALQGKEAKAPEFSAEWYPDFWQPSAPEEVRPEGEA